MEGKYRKLVTKTRKIVIQKVPDIEAFREGITLLPIGPLKDEHGHFVEKNIPQIFSATTIEQIFGYFNLYWNYLNYGLLKHIIDIYGDIETKQMLQEYIDDVEIFRKETRLDVFWSIYKPERSPNQCQIAFKHSKLRPDSSLQEVEQFRQEVAREFSLPEFVLSLHEVRPGSVWTFWVIPGCTEGSH